MSLITNVQGRVFDPVGYCIYCGSDGGVDGLRTEHIVPFSLGGKAELPEASCRKCEAITSYLDGYLARHVFGELRIHTNLQTRRPKERPNTLPANILIDDTETVREFSIPNHPHFTVVPMLGEAGLFAGLPPEAPFICKAHAYWAFPDNLCEAVDAGSGSKVEVRTSGTLNLSTFARAIAKIAYCNWVASHGLDNFRPLATKDLILGKYPYPRYFVGGDIETPPPSPNRETVHTVRFEYAEFGRLTLIVALVRLFANSGTDDQGFPIYHVILGAPKIS